MGTMPPYLEDMGVVVINWKYDIHSDGDLFNI